MNASPVSASHPNEGVVRIQGSQHEEIFKPLPPPPTVTWIAGTVASLGEHAGRYDAPDFSYSVSYAGTTRRDALKERLTDLRSDARIVKRLREVESDMSPFRFPIDSLPKEELEGKKYVAIKTAGKYIDVMASATLAWLSAKPEIQTSMWKGEFAQGQPTKALNVGMLTGDGHRHYVVCQTISLVVHKEADPSDGIRYISKGGADAECWAIFERSNPTVALLGSLNPDGDEEQAVLAELNLALLIMK